MPTGASLGLIYRPRVSQSSRNLHESIRHAFVLLNIPTVLGVVVESIKQPLKSRESRNIFFINQLTIYSPAFKPSLQIQYSKHFELSQWLPSTSRLHLRCWPPSPQQLPCPLPPRLATVLHTTLSKETTPASASPTTSKTLPPLRFTPGTLTLGEAVPASCTARMSASVYRDIHTFPPELATFSPRAINLRLFIRRR
ncbi:hypothetical protein IQ07DRAFT_43923 [Pyrenochaeta sp. DS3sAY3a]|nr:hypothetical protein IQ07DRAFT_43923 [Pyrenochaeta sp. DS3sAY3a]